MAAIIIDNKALLDQEILGGNVGTVQARKFQTLNLLRPSYNGKFFEAFPTVWAGAYAFQKRLELSEQAALEEWACLFLLQNFGIAHLAEFAETTMRNDYDKDLWNALSGTYPQLSGLPGMKLLRTDKGTIVGAHYPNIFFFPSRDRSTWQQDKLLNRYLEDERLSWARCVEYLLSDATVRRNFYAHLLKVPVQGVFASALQNFCGKHLGERPQTDGAGKYPESPSDWPLASGQHRAEAINPRTFLNEYPLKRRNTQDGWTYFLITDMPQMNDAWMTTAIKPGLPSPSQYRKPPGGGDIVSEIVVEFGGERMACPLNFNDEVVMLKDCLISRPAMCSIPNESLAQKVRTPLHKMVADGRGICKTLRDGDTAAILLAPINARFLKYFPDIVVTPDKYIVSLTRDLPGEQVTWRFVIEGKEITWQTSPEYLKELSNATLALWPPRVARDWGVYIGYGSGVKHEVCGQWQLVGAQGVTSKNIPLAADEYVSIMQSANSTDRPHAMLLRDSDNNAGGLLFLELNEEPVPQPRSAWLSVDFGTSNTCLAYEVGGEATTLQFSLSPAMLWGAEHEDDIPGFVPFKWGGKDGYFPTVLLSRLAGWDVEMRKIKDDLKLEHLFRVDVPGLRQKLETYMFKGQYKETWLLHDDLKWSNNDATPWRSLFLGLVLLYAHAELYFRHHARVANYVFTYPLAFDDSEKTLYIEDALSVTNRIRSFCYVGDEGIDLSKFYAVDESTAIAKFIEAAPNRETLELFIDTGGGTTDIALRYDKQFLVLDSIKVAGKAFFQFARMNFERNMRGGTQFKKHLGSLLLEGEDQELALTKEQLDQFATYYSLAINRLDDMTFRRKESNILPAEKGNGNSNGRGMGSGSFQRYRSRLFFQHALAYALVQACAAAVNKRLNISNGIKLILGGNAWGLLAFAELSRKNETIKDEAEDILALIKHKLLPTLSEEQRQYLGDNLRIADVRLLNKDRLSEAKTAVARGALTDLDTDTSTSDPAQHAYSYAGLTIRQLTINGSTPFDLLWCDLWGKEGLRQKLGRRVGDIKDLDFQREQNLNGANPVLAIFTSLGNTSDAARDLMPDQEWVGINSTFQKPDTYLGKEGLNHAPLNHFISEMLYPVKKEHRLLNVLAQQNGSFENR